MLNDTNSIVSLNIYSITVWRTNLSQVRICVNNYNKMYELQRYEQLVHQLKPNFSSFAIEAAETFTKSSLPPTARRAFADRFKYATVCLIVKINTPASPTFPSPTNYFNIFLPTSLPGSTTFRSYSCTRSHTT